MDTQNRALLHNSKWQQSRKSVVMDVKRVHRTSVAVHAKYSPGKTSWSSRRKYTWRDFWRPQPVHVERIISKKMRQLGEAGVKIVSDLREARVAGV